MRVVDESEKDASSRSVSRASCANPRLIAFEIASRFADNWFVGSGFGDGGLRIGSLSVSCAFIANRPCS